MEKMQEIANRLISNTPELIKVLDSDSVLRPRKPLSPNQKKGASSGANKSGGFQYSNKN